MTLANERIGQLLKVEHYRLHSVEAWAESPRKRATLLGIHSALERLLEELPAEAGQVSCMVCDARRAPAVLKFPAKTQHHAIVARLAA